MHVKLQEGGQVGGGLLIIYNELQNREGFLLLRNMKVSAKH